MYFGSRNFILPITQISNKFGFALGNQRPKETQYQLEHAFMNTFILKTQNCYKFGDSSKYNDLQEQRERSPDTFWLFTNNMKDSFKGGQAIGQGDVQIPSPELGVYNEHSAQWFPPCPIGPRTLFPLSKGLERLQFLTSTSRQCLR